MNNNFDPRFLGRYREVRALGKTATEAYYLAKSYCHFMKRHGA